MEEEVKVVLTGVVLTENETGKYDVVFKGQHLIVSGNVVYVSTIYTPTAEEVMTWFAGTENIEKIIR